MELMFYPDESVNPIFVSVDKDTLEQIAELREKWSQYETVIISNWVRIFEVLICQLSLIDSREWFNY